MRRLERLQREARKAAHARGHKLSTFLQSMSNKDAYATDCKHCGMLVCVKLNPQPNEIDISGEAVAVDCSEAKQTIAEAFNAIRETLYPNGNRNHEWSPDTVEVIARIVNDFDEQERRVRSSREARRSKN